MIHVGINAHLLSRETGYRRAGIHQYIAEVLRHLPIESGLRYTVFSGDPPEDIRALPLAVVRSRWPTERPPARILWEQLAWPPAARRAGVDLLHSMAFVTPVLSRIPAVVTVYDLSFLHYPEAFPRLQRRYLAGQTRRSCRDARRVIAISHSGKADIQRHFGVPAEKIDVIYPGLDARFRPPEAAAMAAFRYRADVPERYVLHVGTLQPRKNLLRLLEAFALLDAPELHLVLIGGRGWFFEEIEARISALGLAGRVDLPGYVPDDELPFWYHGAALFACPSLYEGFGMPIVQALACGAPVVASNTSAMPEAAGPAALLFDPLDVPGLAGCMAHVLNNPDQAAKMRTLGPPQARRFSWQEAGARTADCYRRAVGEVKSRKLKEES